MMKIFDIARPLGGICALSIFVLAIGLSNKVSKGAKLEFDEQASSASVSVSMSVHAGTESDTDTWQDPGIVHDHNMAVYTAVGGAWSSGSASIHSDVNDAYSDEDGYIDDAKLFEFVYNQHFLAIPSEDANHQITPASFSVQLDASGNLYWNLLPTDPNEKVGDLVVIGLWDDWYSVGSNSTNMTYQQGTSKEYWVESQKLGPYYVGCFCPSCDCSTNDPGGPIGLIARLGDKIRLSYNANVDGHSSDDTEYSDYVDSVYGQSIQLSIKAQVEPLNVILGDKRWLRENNLLNALQNREEISPQEEEEVETHAIVKGACADGATQLILSFDLSDWSLLFDPCIPADTNSPTAVRLSVLSPGDKDGHLITDGQDNDNDGYDDIPRIKDGVFTQTWCAPPMFDSNLENKEKMRKIPVQIEIDKDGDGSYDYTFTEYIELVRPPVVMVHGIWGHPWDFAELRAKMIQEGWNGQFLVPVRYNNVLSYSNPTVQQTLKDYISNTQNQLTYAHIATSKVDIVAHSMGGLVAKKLDPAFARKKVRKIITIGTPYYGSPIADLTWSWNNPQGRPVFNYFENMFNKKISYNQRSFTAGGLESLMTTDSSLPVNTQIPGVDCSNLVVGLWDRSMGQDLKLFITLVRIFEGMPPWSYSDQDVHDYEFGEGIPSDWLVSLYSQNGYASISRPLSVPWHSVEPKNPDFQTLVVQVLNQPAQIDQTGEALTVTENHDIGRQTQNVMLPLEKISFNQTAMSESNEPNGTVKILSPTVGQTCTAGGHIPISVEGSGATTTAGIFVSFGTFSWTDIVQLPWEGDVNIPLDAVGTAAQISVIGLDINMNMTGTDSVDLVLDSIVMLEEISLGFGDKWYFDFRDNPQQMHQLQLDPQGRFSDGSVHPLSVLSEPITYEICDGNIATVDANGLITVHSRGTTQITVTCSEKTAYLQIEVDALIGDLDLNGIVNFSDYALFADYWMDEICIESDWCHGADFDKTGRVDMLDLETLVDHWLESVIVPIPAPIPADITGDGKFDWDDMKVLTEQWLQPPGVSSADIAPSPNDGIVNFLDFAILAEHWLEGTK